RHPQILDKILSVFTTRGVMNRDAAWLWEDFADDTALGRTPDNLLTIRTLRDPSSQVWLVVEDSHGTRRHGNFWLFEGDLDAALQVLRNAPPLEFYLVDRQLKWL